MKFHNLGDKIFKQTLDWDEMQDNFRNRLYDYPDNQTSSNVYMQISTCRFLLRFHGAKSKTARI